MTNKPNNSSLTVMHFRAGRRIRHRETCPTCSFGPFASLDEEHRALAEQAQCPRNAPNPTEQALRKHQLATNLAQGRKGLSFMTPEKAKHAWVLLQYLRGKQARSSANNANKE